MPVPCLWLGSAGGVISSISSTRITANIVSTPQTSAVNAGRAEGSAVSRFTRVLPPTDGYQSRDEVSNTVYTPIGENNTLVCKFVIVEVA